MLVTVNDAIFYKDAKSNIMSLSHVVKRAQAKGEWDAERITVQVNGVTIVEAKEADGLYYIPVVQIGPSSQRNFSTVAAVNFDDPVWLWHRRLGHLGLQNMVELLD